VTEQAVRSTVPTSQYNSSLDINIGRKSNATQYADADIDDVKIFNYPQTQQQIQMSMNEGAMRFGP
jgi:hypothetical protein